MKRVRELARVAACVVFACVFASADPAQARPPSAMSLSFAPFHGPGGRECAETLSGAASELGYDVRPYRGRSVPVSGSFGRLRRFLTGVDSPVVIHGFVRPEKLVLEAYRVKSRQLVGLVGMRTAGRCHMTPRGHALLDKWLSSIGFRRKGQEPLALGSRAGPVRSWSTTVPTPRLRDSGRGRARPRTRSPQSRAVAARLGRPQNFTKAWCRSMAIRLRSVAAGVFPCEEPGVGY